MTLIFIRIVNDHQFHILKPRCNPNNNNAIHSSQYEKKKKKKSIIYLYTQTNENTKGRKKALHKRIRKSFLKLTIAKLNDLQLIKVDSTVHTCPTYGLV